MKSFLKEGLSYHDLEGVIVPVLSVDEYSAKMGKDSDIITMSFTVKSEMAGKDLAEWFEKGYDWVLDADVSEGELVPGKWLVFVELNRRSTVPSHIVEILSDLKTLTNINLVDWVIKVDDQEYDPDPQVLKQVITISPHEYRIKKEALGELNEMLDIAGLNPKPVYNNAHDDDIEKYKNIAGL